VASSTLELLSTVECLVAAAGAPAVLDPGEEPLPLIPEHWSLSEWNGRVILHAWTDDRNLVRRITAVREQRRDRLSLDIERFPKTPGQLQIADLAAPGGVDLFRRTSRLAFRDRFALMLRRDFPLHRLEDVSAEPNLEATLSPAYVRAFLRRGASGIAALAAPPDCLDPAAAVTFGLIWLNYLRSREKQLTIDRLLLAASACAPADLALRAALLNPAAAIVELHTYDDKDRATPADFSDAGNAASTLPPCRRPVAPNAQPPDFSSLEDVDAVSLSDGAISLRIRGLEFARWVNGKLSCGIGNRRRASLATVAAMAREVARVRTAEHPDPGDPLFSLAPEGWLESQVRAHPEAIDAILRPTPLYGQVPIFASPTRGIIDLLAVDHAGRLTVIELKASADPQLPFQALDYWIRVRQHLNAGDFERLGYFPGITLRRDPPRILLVAPALEFHSTSETLLRHLPPSIDVTRIGLAQSWRKELRVMFRLKGAEHPQ
jgi:hypothetical protein